MKLYKIANTLDTAAVVVFNSNNQALVLKRGPTAPWEPNRWNLPGGGIDDGESPPSAAIRECQEEAGITPNNLSHLGNYGSISIFTGESDSSPSINFESSESKWVNAEEAQTLDLVNPLQSVMRDAFNSRPQDENETREIETKITQNNTK